MRKWALMSVYLEQGFAFEIISRTGFRGGGYRTTATKREGNFRGGGVCFAFISEPSLGRGIADSKKFLNS